MKKLVVIFFLFVVLGSLFAWREGEMEVHIFWEDQQQLSRLYELGLEGDIYPNGEALVYVIPSEFNLLQASGLRYQIEKENLREFAAGFWQNQDLTREAYHTWSEIIALADSLAAAFPNICAKYIYGSSMGGKELGALKISDNVTLDENEAEVMFDGGIHGDEIGGPENCIRFARDLCLAYGNDPAITNLIDNREIWIYYMVNPDGRASLSRYNNNGVDLNRDSGYMWDAWSGSTGAFSQIESKALRDITFERNFVVHTTYHSGTVAISHPWSYRASQSPDHNHINQLAGVYASTSGYSNLPYYQGYSGMYAINGSTKDTNYGAMGSISWSMEISVPKQPPASQLMMYYNYNKPAMLAMIEYAGYGLEGIVTDATSGEPVAAIIFINNYFPSYTDPAVGDYHKYVLPGTYSITVVANGYQTQTLTGITVTANNATVANFQLQPADGQFVYKIRSSQIPGNNPADEGDTPGVIGAPDGRYYSIGKNGWIVVDMQYPIIDGPGNDLIVYEGDTSPEGYTVFAGSTPDGPWISLGTGNGTTEFDLANGNVAEAQFFKILDDGDGSANVADAGFDLDAVAALESISGVYLALVNYYVDDSAGNGNGRIDPGETVDIVVTLRNNGDQNALGVNGIISTGSPWISLNSNNFNFGNLDPLQTAEGIFVVSANLSTPSGEDFILNLSVSANAGAYTNDFQMLFTVGGYLLEEDFSSFPPAGWTTTGGSNWQGGSGNYAGGTAPEARFYWSPSTTGVQRLISQQLNTTGSSTLQLEFKHFLDHYSGAYTVKVQTTADGNTWNDVWSIVNPTGDVGPEVVEIEVSNANVGSSTFQIAWVFDGYSWNINNWYVDDVLLGGGSTILPGTVAGIVTDAVTGNPLAGVDVNGYTTTAANGAYSLDLLPGTYDLTFSLIGYVDFTAEDVTVTAGETTTLNVELTPQQLNPPLNLEAEVVNFNDIELTWDAPTAESAQRVTKQINANSRELIGYNIYLDGVFLVFVNFQYFTFPSLNAGNYSFYVTAVYDEGESCPSNNAFVEITLPAPQNLTAVSAGTDIVLSWEAPQRNLEAFNVYRDDVLLGMVYNCTYTDVNVPAGTYIYGVCCVFSGGYESALTEVTIEHTGSGSNLLPAVTELTGIYPNPFNPSTTVSFGLQQDADVGISVYNLKGQKIRTLIRENLAAGYHQVQWNGSDENGKLVSSGVYFIIMDTDDGNKDFTICKKVILLK